jgi:hypothetical protein
MQNPVMEPAARDIDELPPLPPLPLPAVVDAPAVVFVGLLAGGTRPLVLDASAVREVEPAAARMLLSLLEAKRDASVEARIQGASAALRRRFHAHGEEQQGFAATVGQKERRPGPRSAPPRSAVRRDRDVQRLAEAGVRLRPDAACALVAPFTTGLTAHRIHVAPDGSRCPHPPAGVETLHRQRVQRELQLRHGSLSGVGERARQAPLQRSGNARPCQPNI